MPSLVFLPPLCSSRNPNTATGPETSFDADIMCEQTDRAQFGWQATRDGVWKKERVVGGKNEGKF